MERKTQNGFVICNYCCKLYQFFFSLQIKRNKKWKMTFFVFKNKFICFAIQKKFSAFIFSCLFLSPILFPEGRKKSYNLKTFLLLLTVAKTNEGKDKRHGDWKCWEEMSRFSLDKFVDKLERFFLRNSRTSPNRGFMMSDGERFSSFQENSGGNWTKSRWRKWSLRSQKSFCTSSSWIIRW